jgi:general secretion pathway protein A
MTKIASKKRLAVYSDFDAARDQLARAIPAGPFYGILVGPSGSGKTSLLREVASTLDRHRFQSHYLAHSGTSTSGLGRFLAEILHITPRRSHTETLHAMSQALRALPFRIILFVDEAHLLGDDALQEVRLLAESELESPPLFTVLLSGAPELKKRLDAPFLFPLKRRITVRLELTGLRQDEVGPFLSFRLGEEAASRFSPEILPIIFERTRGIPALVECLARLCLESVPEKALVTLEAAQEAIESWEVT